MSLSLGFNTMRPPRVHSLPGATYSQAVPPQNRRRRLPPRGIFGPPAAPSIAPPTAPSVTPVPPSQVPVQSVSLHSASAPMLSRRMQFLEDAFKKSTELAEQFRNARDDSFHKMQDLYEELQQIFGIAEVDLIDAASTDTVAREGSQVALLYPMQTDDEGKVFMRMKHVHPDTAKLSLLSVCVYDPASDVPRRVSQFSATPH